MHNVFYSTTNITANLTVTLQENPINLSHKGKKSQTDVAGNTFLGKVDTHLKFLMQITFLRMCSC